MALISSPSVKRSAGAGMLTLPRRRIAAMRTLPSISTSATRLPACPGGTVATSELSLPKSNDGMLAYATSCSRSRMSCAPIVVGENVSMPSSR